MKNSHPTRRHNGVERVHAAALGALALAAVGATSRAQSQVYFSVDWHGPTKSRPDSAGAVPITEGDVLRAPLGGPAFNTTFAPQTVFTGQVVGITLYPSCLPGSPGQPCGAELDALSFGNEPCYVPGGPPTGPRPRLYFSVDRFAQGVPGSLGAPGVRTESPARDAAADVYTPVLQLNPPVAPAAVPPSNIQVLDGDGRPSASGALRRGVGLFEPHAVPPVPGADSGDNLDALHIGQLPTGANAAIYFSLDGGFPDVTGVPNTNSAALNGTSPAAVMRKLLGGGSATVYASPSQLGLHPTNDDIDALSLRDNGDGVFQPSQVPFDWICGLAPAATDMLLFSVRRGSALIGQPDSQFGLPIEPGDVLTTPIAGGNGRPAIFIAAEALGLRTMRSDGAPIPDELDAIALDDEPYFDCNNNGVEDAVDIAQGFSSDTNNNGIPDECEQTYTRYCTCEAGLGPCGNDSPGTGCLNSTGVGGLLCGVGTTSVATDDLEMDATGLPPGAPSLLFSGTAQVQTPFGDGLRCVSSSVVRLGVQTANGSGIAYWGPGILNTLCTVHSICLSAGSTRHYQVWYRNAPVYCTPSTFNLTNGLSVTYTP